MKNRKSQAGVSLVEVIIVATIFLIFVTGVLGFMMRSTSSFSQKIEKNKVEEDKIMMGTLIRPDFETAGAGIASYSNHTYGTAPAAFSSNLNYYASCDGMLVRLAQNPNGGNEDSGDRIRANTVLGSETGSVTVKMSRDSYIQLTGENRNEVILQVGSGILRRLKLFAYIDGETIEIGEHTPGTTYRIGLTPDAEGKAVVISQLSEEGEFVEILRKNRVVPQGMITVSAFIKKSSDFMQVKMTGAPLIDTRKTDFRQPALFVDTQLGETAPGTVYENKIDKSVTLLAGDSKTGASFLQQAVSGVYGQTTLNVTKPQKGAFNRSDYGLIIDYARGVSVLVEILDVTDFDENSQAITVAPVISGNRAWDRFYSTDESLAGTYEAGSKFIKLAVPITYRIAGDNRLVREVGGRSDSVAFNVQSFDYSEEQTKNGPQYRIEVRLAADGRATGSEGIVPVVTYEYTASPRALNVANQTE